MNDISSFFFYMWNAWSKQECDLVFGNMSNISGINGVRHAILMSLEQLKGSIKNLVKTIAIFW